MRRILLIALVVIALDACKSGGSSSRGGFANSGTKGEIVARGSGKSFTPIKPYGMVPIPSGSFVVGQTDYSFTESGNANPKTVTVQGFFMDDTEVTNAEYRDFTTYVRDSVTRWALAEKVEELGAAGDEGIGEYAFYGQNVDDEDLTAYQEYLKSVSDGRDGGYDSRKQLNWDVPLYWDIEDYPDVAYAEVLEGLHVPPAERINGERVFDVNHLNFRYTWIDTRSAALNKGGSRSDYMVTEEFNIYPDSTSWVSDFTYSYNEDKMDSYFWNESFDDYPVVGVTWDQANAFCSYKTIKHNAYLKSKKKSGGKVLSYRLPTEIEWEYAARGGLEAAPYPWGGPYLTDDRGCYLANFKPKRGDYLEGCTKDGGYLYTGPVRTFPSNGYGLYDMAGNVSEWTSSSYESSGYDLSPGLNPSSGRNLPNPKKVIRGGSWKDFGFLLEVSYRDYEDKDSARSYIGFRTVQSIPEGANLRYPNPNN